MTPQNHKLASSDDLSDLEQPWNPDHFGEVGRKVEPDGQLTIFWDDTGEPPDPDDYPNIKAYQQAWRQWENSMGVPA